MKIVDKLMNMVKPGRVSVNAMQEMFIHPKNVVSVFLTNVTVLIGT